MTLIISDYIGNHYVSNNTLKVVSMSKK